MDDAGARASVLCEQGGFWAPPADIIRHLARKTVSTQPHKFEKGVSLQSPKFDAQQANSPGWRSDAAQSVASPSEPKGPHVRLQFSDEVDEKFDATAATTLPSTSYSRRQSPLRPGPVSLGDTMEQDFSTIDGGSPGATAMRKSPGYGYPTTGWSNTHDVAWNGCVFKGNAKGLYEDATPKMCCCRREFEPGVNCCIKCGTRRPVPAPDKVKQTVKAMHKQDPNRNHPDPFERQYLMAAVYDQKKYKLRMASYDDEQEFFKQNGHFTPQLSEKSMAIADAMGNKPLHERTDDILYKKNEYLSMRRQQVYDSEVCKECTFCPRLHPESLGLRGRDRRTLFRWDNRRAQKVNTLLSNQLEVEASQCPFVPELSATSRRIAKDYSNNQVHERLVQDGRRRHLWKNEEVEYQNSLKPKDFVEDNSPKKQVPASPNMKRAQSARGRQSVTPFGSPLGRGFSASNQSRSASPKGRKDSPRKMRNEPTRASLAVMPSGLKDIMSSKDVAKMKDQMANYKDSVFGSTARMTGRGTNGRSLCPSEKPQMILQKTAVTNGKNTVKYDSAFAGLMLDIQDGRMADEESAGSAWPRGSIM